MLLNLRAKCINNNGASATYTWRNIECNDEAHGHELARQWGEWQDNQFKAPDVDFPYQLKTVETSLPSTAELDAEREEWIREKVMAEYAAGGYDDY
jgi:hypothetical protein